MHSMKRHLAAATALVFVLAAVAGSALAAPPSTPPGQEQTPPGQEKKAEPAPAATPAPAAAATPAPGQEKKAEKATTKSTGVNSTSSGVKPGNSTEKGTKCTTGGGQGSAATCMPPPGPVSAGSTSDRSKRYGNGNTAAQGINARGGAGTEVYGPGNSQPHKVCKKVNRSGKEVWSDWHAVKQFSANQCEAAATTSSSTEQKTTTTTSTSSSSVSAATASQTAAGSTAAAGVAGVPAGTAAAAGGVAGVQATAPAEAGGVLGAFAELGSVASGTLPFTGLPLWMVVLIALAAIAIGIALYRRSHPMSTRDVV